MRRHERSLAKPHYPAEVTSWLSTDLETLRQEWAEAGYTLDAFVTIDASLHPSGGADAGSNAVRGLLDAVLSIDSARALDYEGGNFVAGIEAFGGDDGSAKVGVVQNYSNIDAADDRIQINRLWYQHEWNEGRTSVRVGKMDANTQFAAATNASHFIHSSMGYSPTILGFPTYPDTAFGITAHQHLTPEFYVSGGVFDGAGQAGTKTGQHGLGSVLGEPDGTFLIAQAGYEWKDRGAPTGRVAVGAWNHTGDFARFDGGNESGTYGFFSVIEQRIDIAGRACEMFMQLGTADRDVASIENHVGLGLTTEGIFMPKIQDTVGLGLSFAELSSAPGTNFGASSETALEAFYGFQFAPGIRVKPDIQYIKDPGGDDTVRDAWIFTLRMTVSL